MRAAITVGILAVLAVVTFNGLLGPSVSADTPVVVYAADPIKVILPSDPDAGDIAGYVYAELVAAAKLESGTLSNDLRSMSKDSELIEGIAANGSTTFARGRAAALAYPLYRVTVSENAVFITTATLELLPQHWALGSSIGHEDGHATINRMLAESCAASLVAQYAGRRGTAFEISVQNGLHTLGDEAHNRYHGLVNGSRSPAYARSARDSADAVIASRC